MPIPESAQGTILDVRRLMAFKFEEPVDVLVFYAKDGTELTRLDHFWSIDRPKSSRSVNADQFTLMIVEDEELEDSDLDEVMAVVETVQYEVQSPPPPVINGIQAAPIINQGTGYSIGDAGIVLGGNFDAVYEVTGVGPSGEIEGLQFTAQGSGYGLGNVFTEATTGVGTGLEFEITVLFNLPFSQPVSGHYEVKVADRPQPGKNRTWVLKATKPKFKSKYFRASGVNR